MRALSLHSDIEHEIWVIMKELVEEHGMSLKDATEAVLAATHRTQQELQSENA